MLKQYFCLAVKHSEFYLTLLLLRPENIVKTWDFIDVCRKRLFEVWFKILDYQTIRKFSLLSNVFGLMSQRTLLLLRPEKS
jgi:hypothetical protein